jgi:hypothetical protein
MPTGTPWRWIALGSFFLWSISLLAWLLRYLARRRKPLPASAPLATSPAGAASVRECQKAFIAAARSDDTSAQVRTLLAWARAERPAIQNLGDLVAGLGDETQRKAVADLQQRHYAGRSSLVGDPKLADVFKQGFVWLVDGDHPDAGDLPPLYPFKLH